MSFRNAALLLAAHGSTVNADSSEPTYQHARVLRERNVFAEVHECFWKEEPNFRNALDAIESDRIYVVPNFVSSGYFTEQVIPRELELSGPITRLNGKEIFYCDPLGLHPSMTDVLLHRAREVVERSGTGITSPTQTATLFLFGHGTTMNENSTKIIYDQVERIRGLKLFADCRAAFMEEAPFIKDWKTMTQTLDIICVPFFVSDGLHSYEDIPVLLGLTDNVRRDGVKNPYQIDGHRLWYATAIGTDPGMADVILAQVKGFNDTHGIS